MRAGLMAVCGLSAVAVAVDLYFQDFFALAAIAAWLGSGLAFAGIALLAWAASPIGADDLETADGECRPGPRLKLAA